jgi:hypothetical protein
LITENKYRRINRIIKNIDWRTNENTQKWFRVENRQKTSLFDKKKKKSRISYEVSNNLNIKKPTRSDELNAIVLDKGRGIIKILSSIGEVKKDKNINRKARIKNRSIYQKPKVDLGLNTSEKEKDESSSLTEEKENRGNRF